MSMSYYFLHLLLLLSFFFFFNDTATTEIYTLSLHDALPICVACTRPQQRAGDRAHRHTSQSRTDPRPFHPEDRKSTRLNSSHVEISYAVFCLKKKNKIELKNSTRDHTHQLSATALADRGERT